MHSNLVYPNTSIVFARETYAAWWLSQHAAAYVVAQDSVARNGEADGRAWRPYLAVNLSNLLKSGISGAHNVVLHLDACCPTGGRASP